MSRQKAKPDLKKGRREGWEERRKEDRERKHTYVCKID